MLISQKCQYALRAVFELSRREGRGPTRIADIANAQAIPHRFLEVILSQLKRAGLVASQRGNEGGYSIARSPREITVGDVIRFVQGPIGPVECVVGGSKESCPLYGDCVFLPLWQDARQALLSVYDGATFQDLVEKEKVRADKFAPCYSI